MKIEELNKIYSDAVYQFGIFLKTYGNVEDEIFTIKTIHTYHVVSAAKEIATALNLSKEDILLAELIGLLHDIGRFEELSLKGELDNVKFNHAMCGSKMLFEDGLIRDFIKTNKYDEIIKVAIENHNKLKIESGLDERTLLHCKIIRDADKFDNFRVIKEKPLSLINPKLITKTEDISNSIISEEVYNAFIEKRLVKNEDLKTPLDFYVKNLAFVFDINFDITYKMIYNKKYIDVIINRFYIKDKVVRKQLEEIRKILDEFLFSCIKDK